MANIGKNVIENLTTAMYENSYTIYREYIQNSADSIDKAIAEGILLKEDAIIDINIEMNQRRISIYDNAKGISVSNFNKILTNIADSKKDRKKEKGFRGIGRLAGVAYCDKLIFKSSYKGEDIESILEWDGMKLREVLNDTRQHPSASKLVDDVTNSYTNSAKKDSHYFEVILENVVAESDNLLEKDGVIEYLRHVAPIPFSNAFYFRSKIQEFCEAEKLKIDEYNIQVNGSRPLDKYYVTRIYDKNNKVADEISDLEFRKFINKDGKLIAWMWFGVIKFNTAIHTINKMRCLRLRKENIQIGNERTLGRFFKEPRGNSYFIGEIYALDSELIPNARRDYFNQNSTCRDFENAIIPVLYTEFSHLYRYASEIKKIYQRQNELIEKEKEYEDKINKGSFINEEEQKEAKKELEAKKEKVQKEKRTLELRQKDAEMNPILNRVFTEIQTTYKPIEMIEKTTEKIETADNQQNNKNNKKYLSQSLSKYGRKEQKLISHIYEIIINMLPKDTADMVVAKIQEELNK